MSRFASQSAAAFAALAITVMSFNAFIITPASAEVAMSVAPVLA